jgi:hypothetical protein
MDTAELLIHSLHRINITGLEISFIILNNLNNLNYQLLCAEEVKTYLKNTYQSTLKKLLDNNDVKMEEILYFYQTALSPTNHAFSELNLQKLQEAEATKGQNAQATTTFIFNRPILAETQDFINFTFENLLKNINISRFQPQEIVEFSNIVFPFIFRTASSSAKSNREHSIPMLLNTMQKMIHIDEKGEQISKKDPTLNVQAGGSRTNTAHLSIVNNFAGQIQAILRFNFKSEFNNSSNTMKKIFEICYLFFRVVYLNDKDLFLTQFYLFLDPVFQLPKKKSRDDSMTRLRYLAKIIVALSEIEQDKSNTISILTRKEGGVPELKAIFWAFIEDITGVLLSSNNQKTQVEGLQLKIVNDKLDFIQYVETLPHAICAFVSLQSLTESDIPAAQLKQIKFLMSFAFVSDTLAKKMATSIDKLEANSKSYDIFKYFDNRRVLFKTMNLLVKSGFEFTTNELEFFFKIYLNFLRLDNKQFLDLLKEFCMLLLKSPKIPKDKTLLEFINEFPAASVKMSTIMADLHRVISKTINADWAEEELHQMAETVSRRFIEESIEDTENLEEIKQNLIILLEMDNQISPKLISEIRAAHKRGAINAPLVYLALLSKCPHQEALAELMEVSKTDLELFFQSIVSLSELMNMKEIRKVAQRSLIRVIQWATQALLSSLHTPKIDFLEKRANLLLLALRTQALLLLTVGSKEEKVIIIQLIYAANQFLLEKIPQKFFEDTVVKLIGRGVVNCRL